MRFVEPDRWTSSFSIKKPLLFAVPDRWTSSSVFFFCCLLRALIVECLAKVTSGSHFWPPWPKSLVGRTLAAVAKAVEGRGAFSPCGQNNRWDALWPLWPQTLVVAKSRLRRSIFMGLALWPVVGSTLATVASAQS